MARTTKPSNNIDGFLFNTPEQKVLRYLFTSSANSYTPRVLSSKVKTIRGLGGAEGLQSILEELELIGFVEFIDNRRSIRLKEENPIIETLKVISSVCDLDSLKEVLKEVSSKGFLIGPRAKGKSRGDSPFDLCVVTLKAQEVNDRVSGHPLGKQISLNVLTPDEYRDCDKKNKDLYKKLQEGIPLWGMS
jgi:hypothetical protein